MAAFSVRRLNDVWTGEFRSPRHEHWHFHLVLGGHLITHDNYNSRFIIVPSGRDQTQAQCGGDLSLTPASNNYL